MITDDGSSALSIVGNVVGMPKYYCCYMRKHLVSFGHTVVACFNPSNYKYISTLCQEKYFDSRIYQ